MKRYARIAGGAVAELFETTGEITKMFHPALIWVEAPATVQLGDLYDGGVFSKPVVAAPTKPELSAYAADKRWRVETGGIVVSGVSVATDDHSKMMIMGARIKADRDAAFTTQWKVASGDFVTIDAATIIAISDAVLSHVDACFAAEALVLEQITAGTITTRAQVDAADWP